MKRLMMAALLVLVSGAAAEPVPTTESAAKMKLPPGFAVTLFAGEPDIVQPIAFTFDDRGRMWVVECLSYPQWENGPLVAGKHPKAGDRVVILSDTNNDGKFDEKKVFWDKGSNLTGIELGHGGVWLTAVPNLLFVPDADRDDVPDGAPVIKLDGWDLKARHNVVNALRWGPDGWLWGCNGILSNSIVGVPGTPVDQRMHINCGVWRYHPQTQKVEPVAYGTTNPWGLDFDDYGEAFITNCVIQHLWHVVPGGHYRRMFGQDPLANSYALMGPCVDYLHWAGGHWTTSRGGDGAHSDAGGGHAHSGAAIYLGDQFPAEYRNSLFTCNIHGSRLNRDQLQRAKHSGYAAERRPDFLFANDPWFRGIATQQGPDGCLYVTDWSDTGECHNYVEVDRRNGRIYRVAHGKTPAPSGDLQKLSDLELVKLLTSKNEWLVRHATRILNERATKAPLDAKVHQAMRDILQMPADVPTELRAMWALHQTNGLDETALLNLTRAESEHVRAWAIRFLVENQKPSDNVVSRFIQMSTMDRSAFVRLYLASAMQRMPSMQGVQLAEQLVQRTEDAYDPNIPLMLWYSIEPMLDQEKCDVLQILAVNRMSFVAHSLGRRFASSKIGLPLLLLENDRMVDSMKTYFLGGILEGLKGRRSVKMPASWPRVYAELAKHKNPEVQRLALQLGVVFDDETALTKVTALIGQADLDPAIRESALQTRIDKLKPDSVELLYGLLTDAKLRSAAIRHLAAFEAPETPARLLKLYPTANDRERTDIISTLAARPIYASRLLDAIEAGTIARVDVSAFTVRQLQGLKNDTLNARIGKMWGVVRATAADRQGQIAKWKNLLTSDILAKADRSNGRALYAKNCASCHKMFGEGGQIGPELTGSQRANLDYVLENVLDPNAVVPKEYLVIGIELKNGRTLNGIITMENAQAVTVQTANEKVIIPVADIEERRVTKVSMMPEGTFDKLKVDEVRDLIGYLNSPQQVPMPKEATPTGGGR